MVDEKSNVLMVTRKGYFLVLGYSSMVNGNVETVTFNKVYKYEHGIFIEEDIVRGFLWDIAYLPVEGDELTEEIKNAVKALVND